ncbi:hypothetical protein CEXT_368721 [Caerostris extrusa]|uniref:Uncharacterized protein n=1 Tax=Caerostris extrusa TaxID=172846 RepID=A0AAV4Q8E5_CAEEX|nr:hypothetical protein CEXT_368721 [Caerostris extrusa]
MVYSGQNYGEPADRPFCQNLLDVGSFNFHSALLWGWLGCWGVESRDQDSFEEIRILCPSYLTELGGKMPSERGARIYLVLLLRVLKDRKLYSRKDQYGLYRDGDLFRCISSPIG